MKKLTLILGYICVLMVFVAMIFKIEHWAGANILMILGSFIFAVIYVPLLFVLKHKTGVTGFHKFVNFWVLILMIIVPIGFVIKWMHWTGGDIALYISNIALISLIPVMTIYAFKEKDESKKIILHNNSIVLIFATAFSIFLWFGRVGKDVFNQFLSIDKTTQKEIKFFSNKSNDLYSIFENSGKANDAGKNYFDKATELNIKSDSLVGFIKSIEDELISKFDQKKFPPDSLQKLVCKDNYDIPCIIMIKNKRGNDFKNKLISFKEFASQNTNSRGKEILDLFFNTNDSKEKNGEIRTWEESKFLNVPMIKVIVYLNTVISHIRMFDSETMEYLQFMGSKEKPVTKKDDIKGK